MEKKYIIDGDAKLDADKTRIFIYGAEDFDTEAILDGNQIPYEALDEGQYLIDDRNLETVKQLFQSNGYVEGEYNGD